MKETENGSAALGAAIGLSMVITAGFTWYETALGWCIGGLMWKYMPPKARHWGWGAVAYSVVLIGMVLSIAENAFPQDGTFPFVSLGMSLLLYKTIIAGKETGTRVANVLGLMVLLLVGIILLTGMENLDWKQQIRGGVQWQRVLVTIGVTTPLWSEGEERIDGKWMLTGGILSVLISVMVRGTLGTALTEYSDQPFYDADETIELFGHMEALVAVGILLGTYGMLCWVGGRLKTAIEAKVPVKQEKWMVGLILGIAFIGEWGYQQMNPVEQGKISTIFWGITAVGSLCVAFLRKNKKNEKSA